MLFDGAMTAEGKHQKSGTPVSTLSTTNYDADVSPALTAFMRSGWADGATAGRRAEPAEVAPYAAKRRAALSARYGGRVIVVPAGSLSMRNNDVPYPFRAASDYVWLTGDASPDAVLVMTPDADQPGSHVSTLYLRSSAPRDESDAFYRDRAHGALWTGRRPAIDETAVTLGVTTRPLEELDGVLAGLDYLVTPDDAELASTLGDLRLVKDDWEIAQLADAVASSVRGFEDVVRDLGAARNTSERWIEGTFWRRARVEGNDVGYTSIAAAGEHACVLHWTRNDGPVRDGDLLLLDAGVENAAMYTADVTRTLPISGHFSASQRRVYDLVFEAQSAAIAAVRPGAGFRDYYRAAQSVLARGLVEWGILPASAANLDGPDGDLHRRYTLHGTGHMLGLDVHDCAQARDEHYHEGVLRAGYVLTVEPGLYFQTDDLTVPEELRGIGVRIEDDVVVTHDGCVVLTDALPRDADAVEAWMARLLG
jgi:Xaa-Pro aminopeptidase